MSCCFGKRRRLLSTWDLPPVVEGVKSCVTQSGIIDLGESFVCEYSVVSLAGTQRDLDRRFGIFQRPAQYKTNQDSFFVTPQFFDDVSKSLFGVCDGHGNSGHHISKFVAERLPIRLANNSVILTNPEQGLTDAFLSLDAELARPPRGSQIDTVLAGTTACVAYLDGSKLYVGNCGDSRCVLGTMVNDVVTAKDLSVDHKPAIPEEKARIEQKNGRVAPSEDWPTGPLRVWLQAQHIPGLAMSRSLGDRLAHSIGVSAEPEVISHELDIATDRCLIIGSDGVWEFVSSDAAVGIVSKFESVADAAMELCQTAQRHWAKEEDVCDDITAVVVFFKSRPPS